ncbi:hypothetical protein [Edaphobacter albus]|uniref:hypothetical protein n=1 Tax=Edaphobacter sp. 4G125 TaxID=2763071 RepID=UPI00164645D7|nr:hypothetical protein [Edaphobacter sp. 4G125]QNI37889.1 hypothetical protein H7846_06360 [Edaphobacter sp. 4G125]
MNPVLWGGVVVILLVLVAAITMGKTKWGRSELDQSSAGRPRSHGRVSGGDDD